MKIVKRKTSKILTAYKMHHPQAVQVGCMLKGNGRGKVMLQVEVTQSRDNHCCRKGMEEEKSCYKLK